MQCSSSKRYNKNGNGEWIAVIPGQTGYYTSEGEWVTSSGGYWIEGGGWVEGLLNGYYTQTGEWVEITTDGYYDHTGTFIKGG